MKYKKRFSINLFTGIILTNSAFRTGKNDYLQVFLEEQKCVVKEKKIPEYIADDIKISFRDSDREENSNEENSHEEN